MNYQEEVIEKQVDIEVNIGDYNSFEAPNVIDLLPKDKKENL
ncbi:hypothetical protein [Bacillus sp. XF8]|nr:hypothetical protein [Bacillus sp. XF8]